MAATLVRPEAAVLLALAPMHCCVLQVVQDNCGSPCVFFCSAGTREQGAQCRVRSLLLFPDNCGHASVAITFQQCNLHVGYYSRTLAASVWCLQVQRCGPQRTHQQGMDTMDTAAVHSARSDFYVECYSICSSLLLTAAQQQCTQSPQETLPAAAVAAVPSSEHLLQPIWSWVTYCADLACFGPQLHTSLAYS